MIDFALSLDDGDEELAADGQPARRRSPSPDGSFAPPLIALVSHQPI